MTTPTVVPPSPAENLLGIELEEGWKVIKKLELSENGSGSFFSVGYLVENTKGNKAFLKAIDFNKVPINAATMLKIQSMTEAFNFECQLLEICKTKKMDKVVLSLHSGTCNPGGTGIGNIVPYIIFELADSDIRNYKEFKTEFDSIWILKVLHNIAIGIRQLHSGKIIHQDLKPSNILVFDSKESKLGDSKIADLGRSYSEELTAPHGISFKGDLRYAPIEYYYNYKMWEDSKYGIDLYLLGNLIVFLFTGHNINTLIRSKLDKSMHPGVWGGTYEEIIDYIIPAFTETLNEIESEIKPIEIAKDIKLMLSELCNPDPKRRGHPKSIFKGQSTYELDRYITKLDTLISKLNLNNSKKGLQ